MGGSSHPGDVVRIFWTGGLDSTFRVLQLLHETDAVVQPIYLLDDKRRSAPREIQTMWRIKRMAAERIRGARDRLLPTMYGSFRGVAIEAHHIEAWEHLRRVGRFGEQYPVLASYLEQSGLESVEIGITRHETDRFTIAAHLKPMTELRPTPAGPVAHLRRDAPPPITLFSRFSFPLIDVLKEEMYAMASAWRLWDILEKTWFCFRPTLGLPCGHCQPCRIAQEDGLGRRVGVVGPMLDTGLLLGSRVKRVLLGHPNAGAGRE